MEQQPERTPPPEKKEEEQLSTELHGMSPEALNDPATKKVLDAIKKDMKESNRGRKPERLN